MADTAHDPYNTAGAGRDKGRDRENSNWMIGVILILLGVAFFLSNAGYVILTGNWWAIFIYLAALASFTNAWRSYHAVGGFVSSGSASLIWGLVLTVVASIFLFNLQWDQWWPAILIAAGAGMVVGYLLRAHVPEPPDTDAE